MSTDKVLATHCKAENLGHALLAEQIVSTLFRQGMNRPNFLTLGALNWPKIHHMVGICQRLKNVTAWDNVSDQPPWRHLAQRGGLPTCDRV